MLPRSFSSRLILSFFVLILLTTIGAGIPAYLLARGQAERQAWSQVDGARRATEALLEAERQRLGNLATVFAERPTLEQLVQQDDRAVLNAYLAAFQMQSDLDLLLFCDPAGPVRAGKGALADCTTGGDTAFRLVDGRPALVARQTVADARGTVLGTTLAGIWLDEAFLDRLAGQTGVAQSVLGADGARLASTLPAKVTVAASAGERRELSARDQPYYATTLPLTGGANEAGLLVEVALPVDMLAATERQALLVLSGSTVLLAVLGSLLAIIVVRQLLAPLERLTAVAERIGAGDLEAPIPPVAQPAEVSTLAAALQRSQASMLLALQERAAARDWLDSLIQSIVEGVVTIDGDGAITFMSHGAERLSGWSRSEAVGQPVDAVFQLAEDGGSLRQQLPARGEKREIAVRTRGGRKLVLAVTGAELAPAAGEEAQVALVLRDVTEEQAVRNLRAYFLANISHEFLTPLSTLNASMELLLDPDEDFSPAEMRELLKPSYLSLRALQTLIDNLLESSSIEAGQFTIRRQPVDLHQVLAHALQMVNPLLERRQQTVSVSEPASLPVVDGDAARLTQVVVNLLANASKYSPVQETIDVHIEQGDSVLRVAVADRGPGIPQAERQEVFRRFVRLDSGDSEQYGVGLGLFVVRTTVDAHGGRVGISDRERGGTIVWFELPLLEREKPL